MKNKKLFGITAIAFAICVGTYFTFGNFEVAPEDLEIHKIDKQSSKELTASEVRKELNILIYALDHAYAGKIAYPEKFSLMRSKLESLASGIKGSISRSDYFDKVSEIVREFPDGHFNVRLPGEEIVVRDIANVASSNGVINANVNSFKKKIAGKEAFVVELPTFEISDVNERNKLVESVESNLNSQAIVLDLRGNSGGRMLVPLRIASLLWGETWRENNTIQYYPMPTATQGTISSPAAVALMDNIEVVLKSDRGNRMANEAAKDLLEKVLTYNEYEHESLRKKAYIFKYNIPENVEREENTLTYEDNHFAERGYKKPVFVLVDQECASACELLLESLEAHPNVKVLGKPTQGAVQFGRVGVLVLPKSHLHFVIATSFKTYKDGRIIERVGYKPQYALQDGEDPYTKIAELLR